jgi:adenylate cyclase
MDDEEPVESVDKVAEPVEWKTIVEKYFEGQRGIIMAIESILQRMDKLKGI